MKWKMGTNQKGFMSTTLSKKVALSFAFGHWSEDSPKIPVLLEIWLEGKSNFYGYENENI